MMSESHVRSLRALVASLAASGLVLACSGGDGTVGTPGSATEGTDPGGGSSSSSSSGGSNGASSGGTTSSSSTRSAQSEQVNGGCPSRPEKLVGKGAEGASCSTYADCKPTCCGCGNGDSFLAAACVDGKCGGESDACNAQTKQTMCGSGASSSSSSSSSSSGSSGSSGSAGKQCVPGTSSGCFGTGMTWTGSLCCVAQSLQCVSGTSSACFGSGMLWTGQRCCLDAGAQCVAGTSSSCFGSDRVWTGALCCLK